MLILVMVLLGVLFVTGVAFLATMNYQSEMISVQRQTERGGAAMDAVQQRVQSVLRDALAAGPDAPFGGNLDDPFLQLTDPKRRDPNASAIAMSEIPGVHNYAAPIEPYLLCLTTNCVERAYVWPWFTDIRGLNSSPCFNGFLKAFGSTLDARWLPNRVPDPKILDEFCVQTGLNCDPTDWGQWNDLDCNGQIDPKIDKLEVNLPVDTDGDGVVDALQFNVRQLGLSDSRIADVSAMVNPESNPEASAFLSLRVVSHGGMVNLNDSHQLLIANALDLRSPDATGKLVPDAAWLYAAGAEPELGSFRHSPTLQDAQTRAQALYWPQAEEGSLRHRGVLPPLRLSPALIQGNALLDSVAFPTGLADIPWLMPPVPGADQNTFGTVFTGGHRYVRYTMAHEKGDPKQPYVERFGSYPDTPPLWGVRMEPFEEFMLNGDFTLLRYGNFYDRRHLLTTVSHDALLSRTGRVEVMDPSVKPGLPPPPRHFDPPRSSDITERMIGVNATANDPEKCPGDASADGLPQLPWVYEDDALPFEYADYPQTIPNEGCDCAADPKCRRDPRKGRLQLSLPWIDENLFCENPSLTPVQKAVCTIQRQRLIYDAFYMLVRNATGPYWAEIDCTTNAGACVATSEVCLDVSGDVCSPGDRCVCHDPVTRQTHRNALIARTAASLTANMLDYVDVNDVPARVAVRSFDFANESRMSCAGGPNHGRVCATDGDCASGACVLGSYTLGREIDLALKGQPPKFQYVYGLERQPYITEVITAVDVADDVTPPKAWAVELFNPYDGDMGGDRDGDGMADYWLVVGNGAAVPDVAADGVPLPDDIRGRSVPTRPNGSFTVFVNNPQNLAIGLDPVGTNVGDVRTVTDPKMAFAVDETIYLVRRIRFAPGEAITDIVADQFRVTGSKIGRPLSNSDVTGQIAPFVLSAVRAVSDSTPWKATVPITSEGEFTHALAAFNGDGNAELRPVEVNFANTGRFNLDDPSTLNFYDGAFPTTGSLLLLMRHANRALADYRPNADPKGPLTELAFTTSLDDLTTFSFYTELIPGSGTRSAVPVDIEEWKMIDNGHLPVFDPGLVNPNPGVGRQYAHHYAPGFDPEKFDPSKFKPVPNPNADPPQLDPNDTRNTPGRLMHLPWGQLVFDYFTALPLSSLGPYANPLKDPSFVVDLNAPPRVDMNGLRVHGRIDINAAPWKVLSGLPKVPAWRLPAVFRDKIGSYAQLDMTPNPPPGGAAPAQPRTIGEELARAIVAYRESREVVPSAAQSALGRTGDYTCEEFGVTGACTGGGRGWLNPSPSARRGTGYLTVGELANVRHKLATVEPPPSGLPPTFDRFSFYRFDAGVVADTTNAPLQDYVAAVSILAALGDWETARSDVFTVYGTVRGDFDPVLTDPKLKIPPQDLSDDVDRRAIRFQETLDRLPMFLGSQSPQTIGRPVVAKYIDIRGD